MLLETHTRIQKGLVASNGWGNSMRQNLTNQLSVKNYKRALLQQRLDRINRHIVDEPLCLPPFQLAETAMAGSDPAFIPR